MRYLGIGSLFTGPHDPSILHEMLNPYFSDHPHLVFLRNAGRAGRKLKQGKKVPDYSFEPLELGNSNPKKARQLWPTIIFEVADSQFGKDLQQACMRWIMESPKGSLKTVVGIDLSRTTDSSFRKVTVTTYRLSWSSKAPPTGWIDAGVQSGRLSLYFHEESTVCFLFLDVGRRLIQPIIGVRLDWIASVDARQPCPFRSRRLPSALTRG